MNNLIHKYSFKEFKLLYYIFYIYILIYILIDPWVQAKVSTPVVTGGNIDVTWESSIGFENTSLITSIRASLLYGNRNVSSIFEYLFYIEKKTSFLFDIKNIFLYYVILPQIIHPRNVHSILFPFGYHQMTIKLSCAGMLLIPSVPLRILFL